MEELIEKMNVLLATSFALYLKTHNFHWNVRGPLFSQYHEFFGDLYEVFYNAIDPTAEEIRALGAPAPGGLGVYKEKSLITDTAGELDVPQMVTALYYDNNTVIQILNEAHILATTAKQYGLLNFLEAQLDEHKKYAWQLSVSMGPSVSATTVTPVKEETESAAATITEEVKTYVLNPKQ